MVKPAFFYATGTSYVIDLYERRQPWNTIGYSGAVTVNGINGKTALWKGGVNNDPFPSLLDPDKWTVKKIGYPATAFPMRASISAGVSLTVAAIKALPAGTPFCLGGYSQGAAVMSLVMRNYLQTTSSISSRYSDFKGATMFGNPCRQTNKLWGPFKTYAGGSFSGSWDNFGSTTGSHGCFPSNMRMTNTPASWFEFVGGRNDNIDIVSCCGDTTNGTNFVACADDLIDLSFGVLATVLLSPAKQTAVKACLAFGAAGHQSYPFYPPPGYSPESPTSYQIALEYLDSIADSLATAPAVLPPTSTAGWSPKVKKPKSSIW